MSRSAIIVGQGLAGSLLGWILLKRGWTIRVIDDGYKHSSSMIAAGMWNPVSFRNLHRTWMADEFFGAAERIYTSIDQELGITSFHPMELLRVFSSAGEANTWDERSIHPELAPYLSDNRVDESGRFLQAPHGVGLMRGAGWLDIPLFLNTLRNCWTDEGILISGQFDQSEVSRTDDHHVYKGFAAKYLILCTGSRNNEMPYFNWLPVIPNKGQVLTVQNSDIPTARIINFGTFLLPVGGSLFRLGATYELQPSDRDPTPAAETFLLEEAKKKLPGLPFQVVGHQAGYRPTVPDRKPLVGPHPSDPGLICFNGFGSKGVLLIPHCGQHLVDFLEDKKPLSSEINLQRYYRKFS